MKSTKLTKDVVAGLGEIGRIATSGLRTGHSRIVSNNFGTKPLLTKVILQMW